jgi:hypothetical protein
MRQIEVIAKAIERRIAQPLTVRRG